MRNLPTYDRFLLREGLELLTPSERDEMTMLAWLVDRAMTMVDLVVPFVVHAALYRVYHSLSDRLSALRAKAKVGKFSASSGAKRPDYDDIDIDMGSAPLKPGFGAAASGEVVLGRPGEQIT